ncbi:MAG: hypothetical protein RL113_219 [Pseudomonadota bacterium]
MPAAVAISASEIAGATTFNDALDSPPSLLKVSKIPITVPKSPIKGEVDAIIESQVNPRVETRIASEAAASKIALLGILTLER